MSAARLISSRASFCSARTATLPVWQKLRHSEVLGPAVSINVDQNREYSHGSYRTQGRFDWRIPAAAVVGLGGAFYFRSLLQPNYVEAAEPVPKEGDPVPTLPSYTMDEVRKHGTTEDRVWITYRQGVYDVTDFVDGHPGGENIMLAAGAAADPFFNVYSIHKEPHVLKILAKYRIGNISKEEHKAEVKDMHDPWVHEPLRHNSLLVASKRPFNAETPLEVLGETFVTPTELFYVRHHLPVPDVDLKEYELELDGLGVNKPASFRLEDLKKLPKTTITATIQCAGNRRSEMMKVKQVRGLDWGAGAIGNAEWTGVKLYDFLKAAGVDVEKVKAKHVQFEGADFGPTGNCYGASIPASKALDPNSDVLLAYEMNGEPLSRDHGFPVRVVVPGVVAARSVKWLEKIVIADEESQSFWQQQDYKGFSSSQEPEKADYSKATAIQEMPVTSAITLPKNGGKVKVKDGKINVKGYAWSGGGRPIIRVDVSSDGGETWTTASLDVRDEKCIDSYSHCWAWTLWSASLPVSKGAADANLIVRAVDASYNSQPEGPKDIWNFRGVVNNPYHRISVKLV